MTKPARPQNHCHVILMTLDGCGQAEAGPGNAP